MAPFLMKGMPSYADRVPDAHALDAHGVAGRRAQRLQPRRLRLRACSARSSPRRRQSSPARPTGPRPASAIRPARLRAWKAPREKPIEVDLVAVLVVLAQERVAAPDAVADAEADGADGEGELRPEVLGGDADDIVHELASPLRIRVGDDALELDHIGGLVLFARLVPGPVEQHHQPLHDASPRAHVGTHYHSARA